MAASREALWQSGYDESVEVNQRALIDKVLARYSGEFTVFRELLQNSDDAASKTVEIHFETQTYLDNKRRGAGASSNANESDVLMNLKNELVHQWTFRNDGMIFREEDWNRLKKIAEGNPDEEKIGAFGVGFYSLFSITEEPFVTSGGQWMGFYWKDKKDQLFARRGTLPESESQDGKQWTTFEMPLREPAPIPVAFDFTRFLASSITFVTHLSQVSLFLNGHRLAKLVKDPGVASALSIPRGLKMSSPNNMMVVKSVQTTPLYIQAEVMRCVYTSFTAKPLPAVHAARASKHVAKASTSSGFFSSLLSSFNSPTPAHAAPPVPPPVSSKESDPTAIRPSSVVLTVFSANVDVRLDKKMALELHRSTKKNPPNTLRLDLIYTGKSEYDASKQEDERHDAAEAGSVFQGLRADLEGSGSARVFIGHATGQTTGIGGHMAARFIPTVERESIDLVDRNVSLWNRELFYVGGFLARTAYETELATIKNLWIGAAESAPSAGSSGELADEQIRSWLIGRCLHALKFFSFYPSTPSAVVSELLEAGFFSCAISCPFSIVSSMGVKSAADVRIPDPTFKAFLRKLPVLPEEIAEGARTLIETLRARGQIQDITFADVLNELRARPLEEAELVACMRWWISVWNASAAENSNLLQIRNQLLSAAVLTLATGTPQEKIVPLSSARTFVNIRAMGNVLPLDGPFPEHTIPISISRSFQQAGDLKDAFGWEELSVVGWLQFVASPGAVASAGAEFDLTKSAVWAERVLNVVARVWPSLSAQHRGNVVELLKDKSCIPTRAGLTVPSQAYFQNAHIFQDLPVVTMPKGTVVKGTLENVLEALGVRKHVDLQIVFNRMIKTGDWTIADLIKYLCAVQKTLTPMEMDRLRQTSAFHKECLPNATEEVKQAKYKACDLYEPLDIFRELRLPVIDWGLQTKWRPSSEEAKFLFLLGLQRQPPLRVLLRIAADVDVDLKNTAMKYFLDNISKYPGYDPADFNDLAFVPVKQTNSGTGYAVPRLVFVDEESAILGFLVVHSSIRDAASDKLKLQRHPPTTALAEKLATAAPRDEALARRWFEVLAGRISDFTPLQLKKLSEVAFVPVQRTTGSQRELRMIAPKDCYFRCETEDKSFHSELFTFVDFGSKANAFLSACGTKHEPSAEEIVSILLSDPRRFYHLTGGRENYLIELRNIAVNRRLLSAGTMTRLKRSPILLGSRRVRKSTAAKRDSLDAATDPDEEEWDQEYDLLKPPQVVVADDTNAYQFFGDAVFSAPQEDLLEQFYLDLGAPRLSSLIREEHRTGAEIRDSKMGRDVRALVMERLPLFLHEHTHARPKVQYSWLNNEKNFVVKTFGKLTVTRHLHFGGTRLSKSQDASAVARRGPSGPVELWLAGHMQVDMYEVATSLCRVLFNEPKNNDSLLFMTILSTDLRSLRRRGYNVDRILKQQRAEREAAERAMVERQRESEKLVSEIGTSRSNETSVEAPPTIPGGLAVNELEQANPRPSSGFPNSLQAWRRKLAGWTDPKSVNGGPSRPSSPDSGPPQLPPKRGVSHVPSRSRSPQPEVTPLSSIEANIRQAIAACREEQGNLLHNREHMQMVKESLDEGYCDVSGRVSDLDYVGAMGEIRVFVSKGQYMPEGRNILTSKRDAIARFIYIIQPLRTLFGLPPTSVHIFFDVEGPTIAFNRGASVFVNLRYFEAWHDIDVQRGVLSKAFISWFYSLAHEIAHNLVIPHNSEHEFYFSSICEAHTVKLVKLLANADAVAPS